MLVLTFQIGDARLALDIRQVQEVVPRVHLQRGAGSPAWLAGMFVYRGRVVPVVDLHRLLGAGECPPHLSSRIVLVSMPDAGLVGLLAAQVADIRELAPRGLAPGELGQTVVDDAGILHLLDLGQLLPEPAHRLLGARLGEAGR